MKFLLTMLCTVSSVLCFAQKDPIKYGDVPLEDLKMTTYPLDSSASAVVLADYGQSTLKYNQNTGFSILFERILRIKILTKDGLDWATVSVPLYHDGSTDEKLTSLRATTYNLENGKVVETKLKGDGTFNEKLSENLDIAKFTLPNVRQGSVIDVSYKVTSEFLFNFQDWDFQRTIPTRWSEYRTNIPEFYHYEKYQQEKENPFKSKERLYPVDFGSPIEKLYQCKITIPDGYVLEELPGPRVVKLGNNAAKYTYAIAQTGNVLNLTSQLVILNSLFPQTEYADLREFYDIIVAKQAEQIVIKKKG